MHFHTTTAQGEAPLSLHKILTAGESYRRGFNTLPVQVAEKGDAAQCHSGNKTHIC